jgi:hypothetical protein
MGRMTTPSPLLVTVSDDAAPDCPLPHEPLPHPVIEPAAGNSLERFLKAQPLNEFSPGTLDAQPSIRTAL